MDAEGELKKGPQPPERTSQRGLGRIKDKLFRRRRTQQDASPDVPQEDETVEPPSALSILIAVNNRLRLIYGSGLATESKRSRPATFFVPGLEKPIALLFQTVFPEGREAGVPVESLDTQIIVTSAYYKEREVGSVQDPLCTYVNGKNDSRGGSIEPAIEFNRTHPLYRKLLPLEPDQPEDPKKLEKKELQLAYSLVRFLQPYR